MNDHSPVDIIPQPLKLRIEDYLALDDAGAFDRYAKTELLGGELFYMNAQHRPHAYLKSEVAYRLRRALERTGSSLYVLLEASVAIPDHSVPEPDIVLTSEPRGKGLIPLPSVAPIVEIADATLRNDLGRKSMIYAAAGIAEYWVANVQERIVHRLSGPSLDGYLIHTETDFGRSLHAVTIEDLSIETDGI